MTETDRKFELLVKKFYPQGRLRRVWELKGGISAQVTALEIERSDGQVEKVVVRQHGERDLQENPQIATDEFKLLQILQRAGIPAPAPYFVDTSGEIFSTPYMVIEFIEGQPEFAPANLDEHILQLAGQLSRIDRADWSKVDLAFLTDIGKLVSDRLRNRPARLDDSLDEGVIRDVLEAAWPLTQANKSGLLHGDFWPGNILWQGERLAAVIDWEDGMWGDPLADLGNSRLEILWTFGVEAMESFTQHYKSVTPLDYTNLPYWDLLAALRPMNRIGEWAGDAIIEKRMRERHKIFITQAFEELSNQGK